jgi:murein tripeptide amidase MpaA
VREVRTWRIDDAWSHADEHDSSWVAQGVIEYLLGPKNGRPHPDAQAIRQRFTVLVLPLLDPDGAVKNLADSIPKRNAG